MLFAHVPLRAIDTRAPRIRWRAAAWRRGRAPKCTSAAQGGGELRGVRAKAGLRRDVDGGRSRASCGRSGVLCQHFTPGMAPLG